MKNCPPHLQLLLKEKNYFCRVAQFAQQCYEVVWQNVEVSFAMCLPIATRVLKAVMYYMMMYSLSYLLIVTHTVYCVDPLRNMGWIQGMFMSRLLYAHLLMHEILVSM